MQPSKKASNFLEGQVVLNHLRLSNNRSVIPLDVHGYTCSTLTDSACVYPTPTYAGDPLNPIYDEDQGLQLFLMNKEFPVSAGHKLVLINSLLFVHTTHCYYHLDGLVRSQDWLGLASALTEIWEDGQTWLFRGSKNRNKVSIGEPAEGSIKKKVASDST